MKNTKPWSKLKTRIENLWIKDLPMQIHVNRFTEITSHDTWENPRHWIVLDKKILWDFPGPFMETRDHAPSPRGRKINYFEEFASCESDVPNPIEKAPHNNRKYCRTNFSSIISIVLRQYIDRPKDKLFDPFPQDEWELTDILKAADARIGKTKLQEWMKNLDIEHPALKVLNWRFKNMS